MPSRFSRIFAAAAVLALPACTEMAGPEGSPSDLDRVGTPFASAVSWKSTEDFAFAVPIYLDCLAEEVVWSGTVRYDDHWLLKPDGTLHVNGQASLLPGSLLSGPSGTWHTDKVISNYAWQDYLTPPGESNTRAVERITWQHASTGVLMDVWFNVHYVIDGQGRSRREVLDDHICALR